MERYTVTVVPDGSTERTRLLIPFSPTNPVIALIQEVQHRVARLGNWPGLQGLEAIVLRVDQEDGPILDEHDLLSSVIIDPRTEVLFATSRRTATHAVNASPAQIPTTSVKEQQQPQDNGIHGPEEEGIFKIRVITAALAKNHKNLRSIPTISLPITRNTTLAQIRACIATHLGLAEVGPQEHDDKECNCSFARQVVRRGIPHSLNASVSSSDQVAADNKTWKFVVVHGKGKVQIMEAEDPEKDAVLAMLAKSFGNDNIERKHLTFIVEMPITTRDDELTVDQMHLSDMVVTGVLNIFAVERKHTDSRGSEAIGKDAIFAADDHWHPKVRQSERGMAIFLSCLRVVSEMTEKSKGDHQFQDAVLHMVDLLVRFPPAIRTMFILINGKTPNPIECSALSQAVYEILEDMIPSGLLRSDKSRLFEGVRLLFGLILEKAKSVKLPQDVPSPYLRLFQNFTLTNMNTWEPIKDPVSTQSGLCERGYYEAFCIGGTLTGHGDSTEEPLQESPLDPRMKRIFLLSAGLSRTTTCLDIDTLNTAYHYEDSGDLTRILIRHELTDVQHLATLCERNELAVLSPSSLTSAKAPALTMDRDGLLAVYTGRQACALPGQDIAIFRPTKTPTESTVDVAIVAQLLAPILEQRKSDGTAVFDAFGGSHTRRFEVPDEILMFCVDCSASMDIASAFEDVEDTGPSRAESIHDSTPERDMASADGSYTVPSLDDLKGLVIKHESFEDMIAIVGGRNAFQQRTIADKVVDILVSLLSRELSNKTEELARFREQSTWRHLTDNLATYEGPISELNAFLAGLERNKQSISDFLIFHAMKSTALQQPWLWHVGQAVPKQLRKVDTLEELSADVITVPHEYICPLSQDLLEDPVTTADGFTYERSAITRWFQIRRSSPLTGLELQSVAIRRNRQLSNEIEAWVRAEDILGTAADARPRKRSRTSSDGSSTAVVTVQFFSEMGSFNREVSLSASVSDLYKVAFRGLKGRQTRFELLLGSTRVKPSTNPISMVGITDGSELRINTQSSVATPDRKFAPNVKADELCLIKVYETYDNVLFSYWIQRSTKQTLASVVWKYWRWTLTHDPYYQPCDFEIWSDLTNRGDNRFRGSVWQSWDKLSTLLTPEHANGKLKNEKVYQENGSPQETGDLDEISDRSSDGSNDEDSTSEEVEGTDAVRLVLKLMISETRTKKDLEKKLTRLDVSKQMFDAFVNRILAYSYKTHMGLITFEMTANIAQPLTDVVENFRKHLNKMDANGDTALWDALALAEDQIMQYAQKFPEAKKRIICLSDGNDTKSSKRCFDIYPSLTRNKIVVDSVSIGADDNESLRTVSYLSGGYKFVPKTLEQAMAICEMEPVLSQLERPAVTLPMETIPGHFTAVTRFTRAIGAACRSIVANPHPYYDVYVSERNISFWKVVLEGPPQSAYEGGTFVLYLHMEPNYPAFPPKGRFVTPIFHPNVNRHGRICHSNAVVTLNFQWDEAAFKEEVKAHIARHASKSRAAWRAELLGE